MCLALNFLVIAAWRTLFVMRNRRRDRKMREEGVSEADRIARGKELGQMDYTDIENPYVSFQNPSITLPPLLSSLYAVPL